MGRGRDLQSEVDRLRHALRIAGIGIWDWDLRTGTFSYSPEARAVIGIDPHTEVTVELLRSLTHPDDLPFTWAQASAAIGAAHPSRQHYEYRVIRADTGEIRWVRAEAEAAFENNDGVPTAVRYLGTLEDIHDRKLAELALADAERRQRLAIDAARMALWGYEAGTATIKGSPELNRLFGFGETEDVGLADLVACCLPGEQERIRSAAKEAVAAGRRNFESEFRIRRRDGAQRWMLLRAELVSGDGGELERIIGAVMDIDERKRSSMRQDLLLRELNHRVKNSLSVVQAIAGQTFRDGVPVQSALRAFVGRLGALAAANDAAMADDEEEALGLRQLIERIVAPYREEEADPFAIACADMRVPAALAVPIALALHELCTNAAKFGALQAPDGRVSIGCTGNETAALLEWKETGGAPNGDGGARGFGSKLLQDVLPRQFLYLEHVREPDGVRCRIGIPLA